MVDGITLPYFPTCVPLLLISSETSSPIKLRRAYRPVTRIYAARKEIETFRRFYRAAFRRSLLVRLTQRVVFFSLSTRRITESHRKRLPAIVLFRYRRVRRIRATFLSMLYTPSLLDSVPIPPPPLLVISIKHVVENRCVWRASQSFQNSNARRAAMGGLHTHGGVREMLKCREYLRRHR